MMTDRPNDGAIRALFPKHSASDLANDFGLTEAGIGLIVGFVVSSVALALFVAVNHVKVQANNLGSDAVSLIGLWVGFAGAALFASRARAMRLGERFSLRRLQIDYGLELRPWPDLLIGIVVGVASQYLLVPLFELPLLPFVPHLYNRLGGPAKELTSNVTGGGLVVLGVLICLGSPLFEELFFRGLVLRGLLGATRGIGRFGVVISVCSSGVLFGLLHFEALQLIGLIGFGIVLGVLAIRTGRLGPGIVAHIAFNATTFIALATGH